MATSGPLLVGNQLRDLARKTLGRDSTDVKPIPGSYMGALSKFLRSYPGEDNFLMDLTDQGGTVLCLDCYHEIPPPNAQADEDGHYPFAGFDHLEAHVATMPHRNSRAERKGSLVDSSDDIAQLKHTPSKPVINDMTAMREREPLFASSPEPEIKPLPDFDDYTMTSPSKSKAPPAHKKTNTITFPDGEVVEIPDSDDDDIQLMDPPTIFQPRPTQTQPTSKPRGITKIGGQAQSHGAGSSRLPTQGQGGSSSAPKQKPKKSYTFDDGFVVEISSDEDDLPYHQAHGKPHTPQRAQLHQPQISPASHTPGPSNSAYKATGLLHALDSLAGNVTSAIKSGVASGVQLAAAAVKQEEGYGTAGPSTGQKKRKYKESITFPDGEVVYILSDDDDDGVYPASTSSSAHPYKRIKPDPGFEVKGEVVDLTGPRQLPWQPPSVPPAHLGPVFQGPPGAGYPNANGQLPSFDASGFRMNYDDESMIRRIDRGGPGHEEYVKEFFLNAMEDFEDMPTVKDAAKKLDLVNMDDKIPGMDVTLMAHQLIGVDWMVTQEKGKIQGGILADDMGLGKTVQTIATMVKNPSTDKTRRSTLIIAPTALLDQWRDEIIAKTDEDLFRVHIHHGANKLKSVAQVKKYDVVITTYATLTGDFPKKRKKNKGKEKADPNFIVDDSDEDSDEDPEKPTGPLALTTWHRVVLDEAQVIRNRNTRGSVCVALLDSELRWCLTGTPITNNLADLYGLLRFIRFRPFNDWKEFNSKIGKTQKKDPALAGRRAQALLKKCLLRRTKNSQLEGKPLLQLGPKHIEVVKLDFSPEERKIYDAIETKQKIKMSKFIKAGTVMKNYSFILVMLLRLRQACNHPRLVAYGKDEFVGEDGAQVVGEGVDEDDEQEEEVEPDTLPGALKKAARVLGDKFVSNTQAKFRERAEARITAEVEGTEIPEEDETCPICFDNFAATCRITGCGHLFCSECISDVLKSPLRNEDAVNGAYEQPGRANHRPCPVCRQPIEANVIFKAAAFEPSDSELERMQREIKKSHGVKDEVVDDDDIMDADDILLQAKAEEAEQAADLGAFDREDEFEPSSKMVKMVALIKKWADEAPNDKIIIYSQWTTMLNMLEELLLRDDIESCRYDGKMSRKNRDLTLARFKKSSGPKIILISLKCGGVGLNLVAANRVISLDLAWNSATENQAFDRAHRLGQTKPVHVQRLLIDNTVETRIMKLQIAKQGLSDAALGEGAMGKIPKMNVNELKGLFGM